MNKNKITRYGCTANAHTLPLVRSGEEKSEDGVVATDLVGYQQIAYTIDALLSQRAAVKGKISQEGGCHALDEVFLDAASGGDNAVDLQKFPYQRYTNEKSEVTMPKPVWKYQAPKHCTLIHMGTCKTPH